MEIRKATMSDVQSYYKLGIEFNKFNEEKSGDHKTFFYDGWEKAFLTQTEDQIKTANHIVYIVSEKGVDVGYLHAYACSECEYCILDELFLLESARGLGAGYALMQKFNEWATHYNYPKKIEVFLWNEDAIEFYQKNGFKKTSVVLEKD